MNRNLVEFAHRTSHIAHRTSQKFPKIKLFRRKFSFSAVFLRPFFLLAIFSPTLACAPPTEGSGDTPTAGGGDNGSFSYAPIDAIFVKRLSAVAPTATGFTIADYTYAADPALLAGLTLNPDTGEISGTAAAASTIDYEITATPTAGGDNVVLRVFIIVA